MSLVGLSSNQSWIGGRIRGWIAVRKFQPVGRVGSLFLEQALDQGIRVSPRSPEADESTLAGHALFSRTSWTADKAQSMSSGLMPL
jgi:hypothetical protein